MIVKHLYQRTITRKGKKIKAWYFWFYDENGKQIRKSCGQNGKPCLTKREAEFYVSNLNEINLLEYHKEEADKLTFADFCSGMFETGSPYMNKRKTLGHSVYSGTIYRLNNNLKKFLKRFGTYHINDIDERDIENWIYRLKQSGSTKNQIFSVIDIVYDELYSYKIINRIPKFRKVHYVPEKKGILTKEEIDFLFPSTNYNDIIAIWRIAKKDMTPEWWSYIFAAMIYLILTTGLRSSEVRALKPEQILDNNVLFLNAMINLENKRVDHLKLGTEQNKKWRVTLIPDKTKAFIDKAMLLYPEKQTDYMFELHSSPVGAYYLNKHFKEVLEKNGINATERNITLHSLRYTYNTFVRHNIEDSQLRLILGHDTESMTDYYDRSTALSHIPLLMNAKTTLNNIW